MGKLPRLVLQEELGRRSGRRLATKKMSVWSNDDGMRGKREGEMKEGRAMEPMERAAMLLVVLGGGGGAYPRHFLE